MNWAFAVCLWGVSNLILGLILNNIIIEMFGLGIIVGGLGVSVAVDLEEKKVVEK